jgi:YD repeat-containing protein
MPYYSFHLSVPAQAEVVAERIRSIVRPAPTFWGTLGSSWRRPQGAGSPFLGSVENLSFKIRRNIQYRNSFLPMIRGKIVPTPTGSRVDVIMYMHPFSLVFMVIWFGIIASIESKFVDMNIARSFLPIGMAVFGLALSLGGFYFEALKVMPLLSEAIFNSEITTVTAPNSESRLRAQSAVSKANPSWNHLGLVIALLVLVGGPIAFALNDHRLRASPAFAAAMNLAYNSAEAKAVLGEPIRTRFGVRGTLDDSTSSGYAVLAIPVRGPTTKSMLYVVANRMNSGWDIQREVLRTDDLSKKIDLTPPTRSDAFRYPAAGTVYLLPLDDAAAADLKELPAYYKERLGLDVHLLPTRQLAPETMDPNARQVIAEKTLLSIAENQPEMADDMDSVMIGVTGRDLNYQSLNLRYGTNLYSGRYSVISTARLQGMPWYAGSNPEVLAVRTRKMVTRNLALLHYPLNPSSDPTSALATQVYTASAVDGMGESFRGQNGTAGLVSPGAPCVSILQGPTGKQVWRLGCINDTQADGRLERFETYTGVPLFVMSHADFSFRGEPSFPFIRKYRPQDNRSRAFGIGATDSFDIFPAGDSQTFSWIELILAGGERIHYDRTSFGTGYANAELRARSDLGNPFSLSTMAWNGNGWDLATRDGWIYTFPSSGPDRTWQQSALIGIHSAPGKTFSIQRNKASDLQAVRAPSGESIEFASDKADRITSGKESSGHAIQYEYDAAGRLVHVRDSQTGEEFYEYDPANRLIAIRDGDHHPLLVNTYGFLGEIQSQTLANGDKLLYESGYDENHKLVSLKLTLPNRYTILWQLTRSGFVRSWPQPPDQASDDPRH